MIQNKNAKDVALDWKIHNRSVERWRVQRQKHIWQKNLS